MAKEKLIQLQFALFYDTPENRPDKLINKIDEALDGIFDEMPTILPIPAEAPPEIPSVIMRSSNGIYGCNIAKTRIDFIVNYTNSGDSVSIQIEKFIKKIRPFSAAVFSHKTISRFGIVGKYFFKESSPTNKIQRKYLKKDLGDLEELTIRFNKRFESNSLTVNDVIDISKGSIQENGKSQQFGIVIQRDMNNIPVDILNIEDVISIVVDRSKSFSLSGISELVQ